MTNVDLLANDDNVNNDEKFYYDETSTKRKTRSFE